MPTLDELVQRAFNMSTNPEDFDKQVTNILESHPGFVRNDLTLPRLYQPPHETSGRPAMKPEAPTYPVAQPRKMRIKP